MPAKRPHAQRKGSLTSKLARASPNGPVLYQHLGLGMLDMRLERNEAYRTFAFHRVMRGPGSRQTQQSAKSRRELGLEEWPVKGLPGTL
eukprot:1146984-Pelagomonas_calceolata.AAC.2